MARGTLGAGSLGRGVLGLGQRMSLPAVEFHNLTVRYHGRTALHHITGQVPKGSLTAIVGANGAGKSTLLRATLGLTPWASGSASLHVPRQRVAYLAQTSDIQRDFPISVLDCAMLGFWPSSRWWQGVGNGQRQHALHVLEQAGLAEVVHLPVGELSGGQFQRLLFVRAILQDAELILLDEPFAAVDTETTQHLLQVIQHWHQQGRTVLAVLHDAGQVRQWFPTALKLHEGRVVAWGNTASVLTAPITQSAALAA